LKKGILAFVAILLITGSAPCLAIDFIVGAKAGYFVWEPYLKEIDASGFSEIDRGTGMLYGPVFSALFTQDISLSLAALTGKQSTYWSPDNDAFGDSYLTGTYFFESKRTDIDAALSYRIMENLKIFAGYKYQSIKSRISYTELRTNDQRVLSDINIQDIKANTPSYGPALGLGYSLILGKGFFLAANLSALYMMGYFEFEANYCYSYHSNSSFVFNNESNQDKIKLDTRQTGLNFEPSIGYSAGESGLMFTLGFRYQWLRTRILDSMEGQSIDNTNDYLYGVFVSVLYTF
jgi:hypothetical protein